MKFLFTAANVGIFSGYLFLAFFVIPALKVRLIRTKIGGILFFLTCGLTHAELAAHAGSDSPLIFTSFHMMAIHMVQLVAVWLFVSGLYQEFVKERAEWPPKVGAKEQP